MGKCFAVGLMLMLWLCMVGSAFAAVSPYSTVPAGHWSYEAVDTLIREGIITRNDAEFYQLHIKKYKTVTRYEMAVVVATAVAKFDQANDGQREHISNLAVEFGDDLRNLGVTAEYLKGRKDKIVVDPVITYQFDYHTRTDADGKDMSSIKNSFLWAKIDTYYIVNNDIKAVLENNFKRGFVYADNYSDLATLVYLDAYSKAGHFKAGRYQTQAAYGLLLDEKILGAQYTFGGRVKTTLNYGKVTTDNARTLGLVNAGVLNNITSAKNYRSVSVEVPLDSKINIKGAYHRLYKYPETDTFSAKEIGADVRINKDWKFIATAGSSNADTENSAYAYSLEYKKADPAVARSYGVWGRRVKLEANSYFNSAYDFDQNSIVTAANKYTSGGYLYYSNYSTTPTANQGFELGAAYVPCKDVVISVQYFHTKNSANSLQTDNLSRIQTVLYY